jgi:hypothetical protein
MKSIILVCLAAAVLCTAAAVDLTGRWTGRFTMIGPNGETDETPALLILKQEGATITGTVGPDENQRFPVTKGSIEGDKITLEADHEGHNLKFDLMLASGRIKGKAEMNGDGQVLKALIDVGRTP